MKEREGFLDTGSTPVTSTTKEFNMIDMGDFWFDETMKPTVTFDEHGRVTSYIYCPYIPKFLFDGSVMA